MDRTDLTANDMLPVVTEDAYTPNIGDDEWEIQEQQRGDMFDTNAMNTSMNAQYALMESGKGKPSPKKRSRKQSFLTFRSASLSISMLEQPSDDRKANVFLAGWNVSNLIQGTGILGVPYAVQQGGWAAVAMIFIVSFLCCHTGKLLIECMYEKSKKTGIQRRLRVNYPEVAEAVMGRKGFILVSIIQIVEMFGAAIMYIVLLGTAWTDMLQDLTGLGLKEWTAINCCIALPSLFITKMSIVSYFSMLSVFSLMASLLVLIAFCFTQIPVWDISNIPPFDPQTFPVGFGIIVFSYCAHAVFPSIEGSMKKPKRFNSMMNYSFLLAAMIKGALGTFMVLTFGTDTEEIATLNLSNHPIFSKVATSLVISNVLLAIPLSMFVVSITFDSTFLKYFPHLNQDSNYHWIWLLMTRPLLLTFSLYLALIVPHFGLLMGVIGSFTGTCLCFLFPCYFHMKLRWTRLKKWEIAFEIAIMAFGLIAGILGLVFSTKALVMTYL